MSDRSTKTPAQAQASRLPRAGACLPEGGGAGAAPLRRRDLLVGALAVAGAGLAPGAGARASLAVAQEPTGALSATALADGVVLLRGAGANVVAADVGDGSAVMIDGGLAAHADRVLEAVHGELGTRRVAALVNTHWHPERVGANRRVAEEGGRIVAHENTRLWLGRPVRRPWETDTHEPLPAAARPQETFYGDRRERAGDRVLELTYLLQAHTDGDACAFLPDANVLVTGGVIASDGWPLIDWWTGGWMGGLVDALDALLAIADERTVIVPGHGEPITRSQLAEQREMHLTVFNRLANLFFDARGPEEAVAARPTREFDVHFGDPERFVTLAFESIGLHFAPDA